MGDRGPKLVLWIGTLSSAAIFLALTADTHRHFAALTHADRFDSARALTCYRETLVRAEPRGMRPLIAHCYLGIGRVHGRLGKRDTAGEHLARAVGEDADVDRSGRGGRR